MGGCSGTSPLAPLTKEEAELQIARQQIIDKLMAAWQLDERDSASARNIPGLDPTRVVIKAAEGELRQPFGAN